VRARSDENKVDGWIQWQQFLHLGPVCTDLIASSSEIINEYDRILRSDLLSEQVSLMDKELVESTETQVIRQAEFMQHRIAAFTCTGRVGNKAPFPRPPGFVPVPPGKASQYRAKRARHLLMRDKLHAIKDPSRQITVIWLELSEPSIYALFGHGVAITGKEGRPTCHSSIIDG